MKKIIIANWKMNPFEEQKAFNLARAIDKENIIIAPPFVFLSSISKILKKASLAAQDVFWAESGAYTGEISSQMLKNLGVKYVIVGHSERRIYLKETDEMINKKIIAALCAGLKVILCIGEPSQRGQTRTERGLTWTERGLTQMKNETGRNIKWAKNYVKNQLEKDLFRFQTSDFRLRISDFKIQNSLIVAYEPVWAIGTGRAAAPAETAEMAKFIKSFLNSKFKIQNSKLLYGGSVNSENLAAFLKYPEIDGALVGGASLKAGEFKKIINAMKSYK